MTLFETILARQNMTTGLWRRFAVHLFEGKVTLGDMEEIDAKSSVWHKKLDGPKLVEMVVIFPSDSQMTTEERVRMTKIIKRWEHRRLASATVILADGLIGSLHRSVLTGLQMLVPSPHPTKVCGSTEEAVRWLAPHLKTACGPDAQAAEVVTGVNDLCEGFLRRADRPAHP